MSNQAHGGNKTALALEIPNSSPGAATNGAGVDMQGYDRVRFLCAVGLIGNGGTFDLRVVGGANANFSGAINITNAVITQLANTTTNVVVAIDVVRPTNRYVRVVATPATNNANIAIISERFRGTGTTPPANPTNFQYVTVAEN